MSIRADTLEELLNVTHVAILADLLVIAAAILAYYVLSRIAGLQHTFVSSSKPM
jgi:hypothetical protein